MSEEINVVQQGPSIGPIMQAKAGKHLTFKLAEEEYGLGILKVQEIIGMMSVTRVPKMPEFIRGVINLRGKVIPVLDLRLKFGMESRDDTDRTCIIVVQLSSSGQDMTMGIIVDEVSEVLDISAEQIEPPPSFGAALDTECLLGIGKIDKKVVMMLDIEKVIAGQEMIIEGEIN